MNSRNAPLFGEASRGTAPPRLMIGRAKENRMSKKIREVYELKDGSLLLVHTDGTTSWRTNEKKLLADMQKCGPRSARWTANAYYDVQAILQGRQTA